MKRRVINKVLPISAYGGLTLGAVMYFMMNDALSKVYGIGLNGVKLYIVTGLISVIISILSSLTIAIIEKGNKRFFAIICTIVAAVIGAQFFVPFTFLSNPIVF